MGRFSTGMRGPDAIRKLNELDEAAQSAISGAVDAVRQAEDARDATLVYRNDAEQARATAVAAGINATEKAVQVELTRQAVEDTAAEASEARTLAQAAAGSTAADRVAVAQIVANGTAALSEQIDDGAADLAGQISAGVQAVNTELSSALSSIGLEVSKAQASAAATQADRLAATTAKDAAAASAVDAATAASVAATKAQEASASSESSSLDAAATAADRIAAAASKVDAATAADVATGKANETAVNAAIVAADRVATAENAEEVRESTQVVAGDRAVVLTAKDEAIQGASEALVAANRAEVNAQSAATILASVEAYGNGWTPTVALAIDGNRRVLRITSWAGGRGTPPATGYLAETGVVSDPAMAINVRGAPGADGQGTGTVKSVNNVLDVEGNVSLGIDDIPGLQEALSAAGQVKTVAGVAPGENGDVPLGPDNVGADPAGTAATEVEALSETLAPVAFTGSYDDMGEGGSVTADSVKTNGALIVNGAAGAERLVALTTGNSSRWRVGMTATPEAGANSGSNLAITRFSDTGVYLGQALYIDRATGSVAIAAALNLDSGMLVLNPRTNGAANIELGATRGLATTPYIDWHSGASTVDYDFRMIASGGNGSNGGGNVAMIGALLDMRNVGNVAVQTADPGDVGFRIANTQYVRRLTKNQGVVALTGDVTLTQAQTECSSLTFTGALTASVVVTLPAAQGNWSIFNATTGGFSVAVKSASAGSIVIPAQGRRLVWCDGAGVFLQDDFALKAIGNLTTLTTTDKTDIVKALNEVNAKPSGGGGRTPLASGFTFGSVVTAGTYSGQTAAVDAPESRGSGFYLIDVVREYSGSPAIGDIVAQQVSSMAGGLWIRTGYPTYPDSAGTWNAWQGQSQSQVTAQTPYVTDLNSATNPGVYSNSVAAANAPVSSAGLFIRVSLRGSDILQEVYNSNTGMGWTRSRTTGNWTLWEPLTSRVTPAAAVLGSDHGATLVFAPGAMSAMGSSEAHPNGWWCDVQIDVSGTGAAIFAAPTGKPFLTQSGSATTLRLYPGEKVRFYATGTNIKVLGLAAVIKLGDVSNIGNVASVAFTTGFDDPELTRLEVHFDGLYGSSASATPCMTFRNSSGDVTTSIYSFARESYQGGRLDNSTVNTSMFQISPGVTTTDGTRWISGRIAVTLNAGGQAAFTAQGIVNNSAGATPGPYSAAGIAALALADIRGLTLKMSSGNLGNLSRVVTYGYRK
ncbi:hypothetical protein FXN63_19765 [Pigmentiphaga aceris]|uniref:Uncharacterized protein n=1 Tax=Pigmentiphaga aceris TaxID=1940612 RepID=A0A5C0B270_9BURK|nr:pyocin knob domain-containing protein [Pigmentiphaga aceris]QEI07823.1 hypothetical protein FXN63_19765 [Pigmentiphaga aceris]